MNEELPDAPMACMNCKKPVVANEAKLFAEVFVCPTCYETAVHFWEKLDRELRYLLVVAKESIRLALIDGSFFFPEGVGSEVSKREVLKEILRMQQAREEATCNPPTTTFTESTQLAAPLLGASAKQGSNTQSRRD